MKEGSSEWLDAESTTLLFKFGLVKFVWICFYFCKQIKVKEQN